MLLQPKMLLQKKIQKKKATAKGNRILINITVSGSAGPIRLVVNEGDLVAAVTQTALKAYARLGRLPILGTDANRFMLYCTCLSTGPMSPRETIGAAGFRNFALYPKPSEMETSITTKKASKGWKTWLSKSVHLKIQGLHHTNPPTA